MISTCVVIQLLRSGTVTQTVVLCSHPTPPHNPPLPDSDAQVHAIETLATSPLGFVQ